MGRQCRFWTYTPMDPICKRWTVHSGHWHKIKTEFLTLFAWQTHEVADSRFCSNHTWENCILPKKTARLLFLSGFLVAGALVLPSMASMLGHGWGSHSVTEQVPEFCGPQHRKDVDLLEWMRGGQQGWSESWSTSLTNTGWERWECSAWRNLWEDLIPAFQYLKGCSGDLEKGLPTRACSAKTRENGLKLEQGRFRLDVRKKLFTVRVLWP